MLVERRKVVFILSVIFFIAFVGVLDSDVYGAKKTPPGKVKIKSASQTRIPIYKYDESGDVVRYIIKQSVQLKWKHVKNADGYVVYRKYKKGKYKAIKNIKVKEAKAAGSILKCTTPQVKKGKHYFKIAAYKLYAGKKYYGKKSSAKGIYVKPKKAIKRWNIGCGSKSTEYGSAKAKKNVKATLYNNGELIISGKGNAQYARGYVEEEGGDGEDDSYYDGMPWYYRYYDVSIDKVIIKKGVAPKSIDGWFCDLSRLKKAPKIPSSVKNMRDTFAECTSLKQASQIPAGVKDMDSTFKGCRLLKQAPKIPAGVKDMNRTFKGCRLLKQAPKIPAGVKNMNSTFEYCESLKQAPEIPSSVKDMGYTFEDCKSLEQAPRILSGVEHRAMIGTFEDCKSLKQAPEIPVGVSNMNYTFFGCESMIKGPSSIPSSVGSMNSTFEYCESLKQAPEIPSDVRYMNSTFRYCKSLEQAPRISSGGEYRNMTRTFEGCKSLKQAPQIPEGVKNMHSTFEGCESLVKGPSFVPSSVKDMNDTFRGCKSMTGTIKIKTTLANVTEEHIAYYNCVYCFAGAATNDGCQIRLDYVDEALVDKILENVYYEGHVVKGYYIG